MEVKLLTEERFVDRDTGCSYRYVFSNTEYFRPHRHEYYELFVLLEGSTLHCVNGAEFPLGAGDLVFIRPDDAHDYRCEPGQRFSMLNFTFTRETAEGMFCYLGEGFPTRALLGAAYPPQVHLSEENLRAFRARMAGVCAISDRNAAKRKTALRGLLIWLVAEQFADFGESDRRACPVWLSELCETMRRDGNFIGGSARLYELSGRSREHTARMMQKHMKMTPSEFVNRLRLNYIANMLRNSNHTIADIVFESGFNNLGWASECFRLRYKMTMRQYREQSGS